MTHCYRSEQDLKSLVEERVSEGVTLEFKSAQIANKEFNQAFRDLSCEVSALANSMGGCLVIGIDEDKSVEGESIASGITGISNAKWRPEWVQSKLEEKIQPKILNLLVEEVVLSDGSWCR